MASITDQDDPFVFLQPEVVVSFYSKPFVRFNKSFASLFQIINFNGDVVGLNPPFYQIGKKNIDRLKST